MAIFLCQFDVCLLQQGRLRFPPAYLLLALLGFIAIAIRHLAPGQISRIFRECSGAIGAFAMIAGLALVGSALPQANLADNYKYVLYPTVDFLVFLLAFPLAAIFASQSNWRATCGMALCALVLSILVDARYPGTFSILDTRAAGFGMNPNLGAAMATLLLVGVLDWKRPRPSVMTCGWCLVAFIGVFMTLSRSGFLVLGIVGLIYVRLCVRRNGIGTIVVLGGLALVLGSFVPMAVNAAKRALPMLDGSHSRTKRFLSGEFDEMDVLDDSRVDLVYDYLKMIEERPLLGWGTGLNYSMDTGSHNMFLARWVENGLPGLGAYLLLIVMLYRIGRKFQSWECVAVAVYLTAESFFSHNLLEDKSLLLMMSISAGRAVLNAPQSVRLPNAVLGTSSHLYPRVARLAKAA